MHSHERRRSAIVFASTLLAYGLPVALAQAKRPDINEFAADWFLAGTAIPTYKSLLLSPGTPYRAGYMWRLHPFNSAYFDLYMTIAATKPEKSVKNDGFAFWYVAENASQALLNLTQQYVHNQGEIVGKTWEKQFETEEMTLMGYRPKFKGFGVFFTSGTEPSISFVMADGTKTFKLGSDIPAKDAYKVDWTKGPVKLKMRVEPSKIVADIEGQEPRVFEAPPITANGFIGLTSFIAAPEAHEPNYKSCIVEVKEFELHNKDPNSKDRSGDTSVLPEGKARKAEDIAEDVLHESSRFKDHRAESDAIKDLTNTVFKLVVETQPMRMQMTRAIESLGKRIATMEQSFAELKAELDKKTGHNLGKEFEAIKSELVSLSSVASQSTQERHKKLETLHSDIAEVHKTAHSPDQIDRHLDKLTQSNSKVLDKLASEHRMMFGVSIAAIAFIIIAGLSLYNKFRCWEKKHIL